MSESRARAKICWGLIAALLVVVAMRLPYVMRPFNDEDVAQIAYSISRAMEGQHLYRDTVEGKPGFVLAVFALAFRTFGKSMTGVNVMALLWAMAGTVMVFLLTRELFGRSAAVGAALFYAVFSNGNTVNGTSPSYDFWMLPLMTAAVYCFVRGLQVDDTKSATRNPQSAIGWWLLTGLCNGLAVTSKQHAVFNFFALLNYLFLVALWDREQRKSLPQRCVLMLTGFALAWLPFLLYFWSKGSFDAYIGTVASNRTTTGYLGARTWADALTAARVQMSRQITRDAILWVFALIGLAHLLVHRNGESAKRSALRNDQIGESANHATRNTQHATRNTQYALLLWLWAFWSFLAVSFTKRFYDHYFQQMLPVLGVSAGYFWSWCFQTRDGQAAASPSRRWAMAAVVAFGFLWSARYFHVKQMAQRTAQLLTGRRAPTELDQVGDYIRAHSTPKDCIYVSCWKPEIYYYADRKAPTKWWEMGFELGMWQTMQPDFERNKPKFIILDGALKGPTDWRDFVRRHYEPATQIGQFHLLRLRLPLVWLRGESLWQPKLI